MTLFISSAIADQGKTRAACGAAVEGVSHVYLSGFPVELSETTVRKIYVISGHGTCVFPTDDHLIYCLHTRNVQNENNFKTINKKIPPKIYIPNIILPFGKIFVSINPITLIYIYKYVARHLFFLRWGSFL